MHYANLCTLFVLVALRTPASALPRSKAGCQNAATGKAVYVITNAAQNAIAAMPISAKGTLGNATITSTSGQGSVALDADGKPATPDALVGQSALTIAGQHIFTVNAGSNTVSMLAISPNDPLKLQMVGQPAAVPGTFPNTVAASVKNSMVCVATSGSQAGVSCGMFDAVNGIGEMTPIGTFDLNQSDPPVGPTNTVSHTFFSADESMLFTTVKGDPAVNNTGFLSVVPVQMSKNGDCSSMVGKETRSSPNGTAVLFGSTPIPGANPPQIFATDASFGAAILSVDGSSQTTTLASQAIDGQKATCWSTISSVTNSAFVTDVGVNHIVEMSLKDASIIGQIDLSQQQASAADPGLIDLKASGNFLYALSPGNGTSQAAISVLNVKSKQLVQHAELGAIGVGSTAQGMAVLA
ncbi:uncharacterized protein N0V89_006471 [Didymosphaeria variabile]|uniref:3-carboxymuconate cyclase n=1 Tax=Didymosphaeria variabile TaxID=1932322 RepID=A0A9W9C9I9_9PLEO|nr:uncharacterized protein N0V89_006471 [Didymosphaeria variabile]KAJ4351132.1 hypothetical protein N0V89_006471 [Didymosphaeria variabile]